MTLPLLMTWCLPAFAQDDGMRLTASSVGGTATERATDAGVFLPLTQAPDVRAQAVAAGVLAGYDGAAGEAVVKGTARARVAGPVALLAGIQYSGSKSLRPSAGVQVQLLTQKRQGIDGAVSLSYKPEGFTEPEGELEAVVSVSRRFGALSTLANAAYGQDLEGRERDGEVSLAALYGAGGGLHVGVDARLRFDAGEEREEAEAGAEELDLIAGPVASYALARAAFTCQAGVRVIRAGASSVGPTALCGVGAAF